MDRLKREWQETRIPEEMRLQARNLAWEKINRQKTGGYPVLRWSIAATVIVIVALWMGFMNQPGIKRMERVENMDRVEQAALPAPEPIPELIQEPSPENIPLSSVGPVKPTQSDVINKPVAPLVQASAPTRKKERERIVLNFNLPESGARLIWIID